MPNARTSPHRQRFTKQERAFVFARDRGVCQLCREKVALGQLWTLDHLKPVSHGGTNVSSNLRLAHKRCNELRGDRAARTAGGGYVR